MDRARSGLANLGKDVAEALDEAFPDGVVEMTVFADESYLADVYPRLRQKLWRIEGADLLYERPPEGGAGWGEEFAQYYYHDDEDEDLSEWQDELSSSYYLFFVGLRDDAFKYDAEGEQPDEDDVWQTVEGQGTIGCSIGVSVIAPFATIMLESMEFYEDGGYSLPDIQPHIFDLSWQPVDLDDHYWDMVGEEGLRTLHELCDEIRTILESLGVKVLSEEVLRQPLPWLKAGEEAWIGPDTTGKGITVKDAFFFRGP